MRQRILCVFLSVCSTTCAGPTSTAGSPVRIGAAIRSGEPSPWTRGAMVSAANPYAVKAAVGILVRGGHAVDAAIAAHAVLGLVEPESSGLGGSAFMLAFDRGAGSLVAYDGREMAPAAATADMFMRGEEAMGFLEAWQTGLSVGVPGAVALYFLAHADHGTLPLAEVLQPAIDLAANGFEVSGKLGRTLAKLAPMLDPEATPKVAEIFYPGGEPLQVGAVMRNLEYAATLTRIATEGRNGFYGGAVAQAIAERARREPWPSPMTVEDVASYEAKVRDPVCGPFRALTVCSMSPPSSGLAQITIANLYDRLLEGAGEVSLSDKLQAFVDAQRLAYADRDHYVADADFVSVPIRALIDPSYLTQRATQRFAPDEEPTHGEPAVVNGTPDAARRWGKDTTLETAGTTHLAIIDAHGNAVSMTASVGAPLGSVRWTEGFLLNNEMTDFAMTPTEDGRTVANVVEPRKRPRSSMSPTIVFDSSGEVVMVTGSPGGNSIVAYVAKSVLATLDWGMTAQQAADFPNIIARGATVRVETEGEGAAIAEDLEARGYPVEPTEGEISGIHIIVVRPDRLEGGADKRREGTVAGVAP